MKCSVIKISGHELNESAYLETFAQIIKQLDESVIIVHGGGKEISALQTKMGIQPQYVDGIRVTDSESLLLVEMALCGAVNKRLVRVLVNTGVDALGLSGVDCGLVRAAKMRLGEQDMGFTGVVQDVRVEILHSLLAQGITPVIAPICLGEQHNFNVNADQVAGALARALDAERLIFLSNVEGIMLDGALLQSVDSEQVELMIARGEIYGGMIPKVQTALNALNDGVKQVVITNLAGLHSRSGTGFIRRRSAEQAG